MGLESNIKDALTSFAMWKRNYYFDSDIAEYLRQHGSHVAVVVMGQTAARLREKLNQENELAEHDSRPVIRERFSRIAKQTAKMLCGIERSVEIVESCGMPPSLAGWMPACLTTDERRPSTRYPWTRRPLCLFRE